MSLTGTAAIRQPPEVRPLVHRRVGARLLPAADLVVLALVVPVTGAHWLLGAAFALLVLLVLAIRGQHRLRICLRVSDQVPELAIAAGLPLAVLAPWSPGSGLLAAAGFGGLVLGRGLFYAALRSGYRRGVLGEPTLVIGAGEVAARIVESAQVHPEFGLRPRLARSSEVDDLAGFTRVLICPDEPEAELTALIRSSRPLAADVCVVPRLPEIGTTLPRAATDELWGVPLIPLRRSGHLGVKRALDIVLSGLMLAVSAPLLLVLAVAVRLDSPGPVLFRQLRVTGPGRTGEVLKLRTVRTGAAQGWAVAAEECTALGKWLRRTHLDELPQLVNVLRGEMSLVGPRPERPHYARSFGQDIPGYRDRHRMPGGMTGWAQVHGLHGDTSIPDRARFDNQYIEQWSPWWDAVIVLRTAAVVLRAAAAAGLRWELGGRSPRHRRPARPRRQPGAHRAPGRGRRRVNFARN